MKLLTHVVATAAIGLLAVGAPTLVLGASPRPGEPAGPAAGATGQWTAAAPMSQARSGATATRLLDGRVFVAGGVSLAGGDGSDRFDSLASAELYDPATRAWNTTGPMSEARGLHTATLLLDGRVLVAGGNDANRAVIYAELYDPASGTWTATGPLIAARYGHTAAVLRDGRVLVTGGSDADSAVTDAELYDPASGSWSVTGDMATRVDAAPPRCCSMTWCS